MATELNVWTVIDIDLERMWMDVVADEFKVLCRQLLEGDGETTRNRSHGSQYVGLTLRRLMSYIYMEHPFLMFLDHTQRRSTIGRTPLDE